MDRRFSDVMLPWIVSEIRKRDSKDQVSLGVEDGTLQAYNIDFELQFSHKIQDISKFSQADTDPCTFLYLVSDDVDRLLYCYMFQASQPSDVSDIYQQVRDQNSSGPNLTSLCGDISPSSSHFFEVLYIGKIKVSHKKVPETFIDDALNKFRNHELARRASYDSSTSTDSSTANETAGEGSDAPPPQNVVESTHDHNRTMVLQVGRLDLRLISPDRKQVLLHRHHRDVTTCVQGTRSPEHFGFICREIHQIPPQLQHTQQPVFVGYIFKCESSSVASDAVGAISQAANAPLASKQTTTSNISNLNNVTTCEHCPMVWYHKLCAEVDGLGEKKTRACIFRKIEQLDESERSTILTKFQGAEFNSTREQNEFLMMLLRAHCEMKQNRHVHDTVENRSEFLNHYLGGGGVQTPSGTIFMKAKRSLSSSFEHLLKRKGSKDDIGALLPGRDLSLPLAKENSPTTPTSSAPPSFPDEKTKSKSNESQNDNSILSPDKNTGLSVSPKSPMMDIFMKVGNNPRTVTPNNSNSFSSTSDDSSPQSHTSTPRSSGSWRQAIFNRVVTPNNKTNPQNGAVDGDKIIKVEQNQRSKDELRLLWKQAIKQAVLLVRMEKENSRLRARQECSALRRIKLEYDEMSTQTSGSGVLPLWELVASGSSGSADSRMMLAAAARGVPAQRRGEVWQRLAALYSAGKPPLDVTEFPNYDVSYEDLLKQLTSHQHAILIDLGRTFPSHAYFRAPLGPGQLALFSLLKAYSLLDPAVGYCQGLSFVAGVLLLHMDEPDAFHALKYLMFRRGMRKIYLPDMVALQVSLYQLSRLLHDRQPELYAHFDEHEVAPTLYAAPWLLTLFASQFPLGFVARVLDILFVDGPDVIFRVALALLAHHSDKLLLCDSFEQIMDYLKTKLPDIDAATLDKVMTSALASTNDVTQRLNEYRVEYQVLQEEANSSRPHLEELERLRADNRNLIERNNALTSQLEISIGNVQRLERTRTLQQSALNRLETQTRTLEVSVATLGTFIDSLVERHVDVEIPGEVRRIVAQLMVGERRRLDQRSPSAHNLIRTISQSANLFRKDDEEDSPKMARKPPCMVKSLSTGRISTNLLPQPPTSNSNGDSGHRSVSLQLGSDLERELRLSSHRGVPLRVIDDESAKDRQNIGSKVSNFFSNTHNQILRQHRSAVSPPPISPSHSCSSIIREESREEMSPVNDSIQEKLPLPLRDNDTSPSDSVDSGMGSPPEAPTQPHPLSGCDVNFTFNGTTKLKNIRTLRSLSRNSSPDLLGK